MEISGILVKGGAVKRAGFFEEEVVAEKIYLIATHKGGSDLRQRRLATEVANTGIPEPGVLADQEPARRLPVPIGHHGVATGLGLRSICRDVIDLRVAVAHTEQIVHRRP